MVQCPSPLDGLLHVDILHWHNLDWRLLLSWIAPVGSPCWEHWKIIFLFVWCAPPCILADHSLFKYVTFSYPWGRYIYFHINFLTDYNIISLVWNIQDSPFINVITLLAYLRIFLFQFLMFLIFQPICRFLWN